MVIRKLTVGPDYKTAMHYIVGQKVINGEYAIHAIVIDNGDVKIWIENDNSEIIAWKSYNTTVPMSIEYNIDF